MKYIYLVVFGFILLSACQTTGKEKKYQAKEFVYKISYLTKVEENPIIALLPETIKIYYTNDYICYKTEGWMGFFSSIQIVNTKDSTRTLLAKFMDKKYAHILTLNDDPLRFEDVGQLFVNNDVSCIKYNEFDAFECNTYVAGKTEVKNKLIYTKYFNIENPNIGTPFHSIKGILLNYTMSTMGIPVRVELIDSKDTLVCDSMFTIPDDYQIIDRKQFERVFEKYKPI